MNSRVNRSTLRSAAVLWVLAATAGTAGADDSSVSPQPGQAGTSGAQIYAHICQGCHMPHGEGAIGAGQYPRLAGNPKLASWQYIALTVVAGRNGMPAFGRPADEASEVPTVHLSDAQIADVVNYVRSHFGNRYGGGLTAREIAALPHPGSAATP